MNILLLLIVIVGWSIHPFFSKIPLKDMTPKEYYLLNHIIYTVPILVFMIFDKNRFSFTKKMTKKNTIFAIIAVFIGLLSGISYKYLLKFNNINYLVPHTNPLIIIFTLILSYFLFNESLTIKQLTGSLLVIIGLFIINSK